MDFDRQPLLSLILLVLSVCAVIAVALELWREAPALAILIGVAIIVMIVYWLRRRPRGVPVAGPDWAHAPAVREFLQDVARTSARTGFPVAKIVTPEQASEHFPVMLIASLGQVRIAWVTADGVRLEAQLEDHVNTRPLSTLADWADH